MNNQSTRPIRMKSAYLVLGILFSAFSMWLDTVAPHGLKTSRQPFINCWYPTNPLHEQHAHDQGVIFRLLVWNVYLMRAQSSSGSLIPSVQNNNLICTHILRMPLSVKSRLRNRPAGVPLTLVCGTLTNCG